MVESILSNYDNLKQLWEECLETNPQPDVKGRVIGVQSQMAQFDLFKIVSPYSKDHTKQNPSEKLIVCR